MTVLAQCGALGAVGTQVDGGIKHWFLAHPHAVFNHRIYRAAHRTMRANRALDLNLAFTHQQSARSSGGFLHQREL